MKEKIATVDEIIKILKKASKNGCGKYKVYCAEYCLVIEQTNLINHDMRNIIFGGASNE